MIIYLVEAVVELISYRSYTKSIASSEFLFVDDGFYTSIIKSNQKEVSRVGRVQV